MKMNPRVTRRQFVKAAATALAAPMIVPRSALGLGEKAAPSERITLAFIGTGKMASDYHRPPGQPGLLARAQAQVGSQELEVRRR